MIVCANCQTQNELGSRFCRNCGSPLESNSQQAAHSPGSWLGVITIRLVVTVLLLWIGAFLLNSLNFMQKLTIPGFPPSSNILITTILLMAAVILLVRYAIDVYGLWPLVFPRFRVGGTLVAGLVVLVALTLSYSALAPFIAKVATTAEPANILQVVLGAIALVVVIWVGIEVYRTLPSWLEGLRRKPSPQPRLPGFGDSATVVGRPLAHAVNTSPLGSVNQPSSITDETINRSAFGQNDKTILNPKRK